MRRECPATWVRRRSISVATNPGADAAAGKGPDNHAKHQSGGSVGQSPLGGRTTLLGGIRYGERHGGRPALDLDPANAHMERNQPERGNDKADECPPYPPASDYGSHLWDDR